MREGEEKIEIITWMDLWNNTFWSCSKGPLTHYFGWKEQRRNVKGRRRTYEQLQKIQVLWTCSIVIHLMQGTDSKQVACCRTNCLNNKQLPAAALSNLGRAANSITSLSPLLFSYFYSAGTIEDNRYFTWCLRRTFVPLLAVWQDSVTNTGFWWHAKSVMSWLQCTTTPSSIKKLVLTPQCRIWCLLLEENSRHAENFKKFYSFYTS